MSSIEDHRVAKPWIGYGDDNALSEERGRMDGVLVLLMCQSWLRLAPNAPAASWMEKLMMHCRGGKMRGIILARPSRHLRPDEGVREESAEEQEDADRDSRSERKSIDERKMFGFEGKEVWKACSCLVWRNRQGSIKRRTFKVSC